MYCVDILENKAYKHKKEELLCYVVCFSKNGANIIFRQLCASSCCICYFSLKAFFDKKQKKNKKQNKRKNKQKKHNALDNTESSF